MNKVIKNGNVAVLYSPGYGAGWYSWHDKEELVFHPDIVRLVETDRRDEITEELCRSILGLNDEEYVCVLGAGSLRIQWLPVGTKFRIDEYDGAEGIEIIDQINFITA